MNGHNVAEPDSLRLFFALWPDETTQGALYRTGKWMHKHWGGRLMRRDTLHLTLAFLGSMPAEQLDTVIPPYLAAVRSRVG